MGADDLLAVDEALVQRLHRQARAARWRLSTSRFGEALTASATRAFAGQHPDAGDVARYLTGLHLDDLALACACASGTEEAWEHFIREHRPLLYRAADALDPSGGGRELADSLYADLFGLGSRGGERQSLFRYFHGRSSLATWLRAVLAQRHVDRLRSQRRVDRLPDEDSPAALAAPPRSLEPERERYLTVMRVALDRAISRLPARDRLRLGCYYAQELTLAETGRMLGEHEATVSRQLARTRRAIRAEVERHLREEAGLSEAEIDRCVKCVTENAGPLDVNEMFGTARGGGEARKESATGRSHKEKSP
jgi:RNA polymerase sigma-70 factor (ECF subfamily)